MSRIFIVHPYFKTIMYKSSGRYSGMEHTWFPSLGLLKDPLFNIADHANLIKTHGDYWIIKASVMERAFLQDPDIEQYITNEKLTQLFPELPKVKGKSIGYNNFFSRMRYIRFLAISSQLGGGMWDTAFGKQLKDQLEHDHPHLYAAPCLLTQEAFKQLPTYIIQDGCKINAAGLNVFLRQNQGGILSKYANLSTHTPELFASIITGSPPPKNNGDPIYTMLHVTNKKGHTALHVAVIFNRLLWIKKLISLGLNPLEKDQSGKSPLQMTQHVEVLRCLSSRIPSLQHLGTSDKEHINSVQLPEETHVALFGVPPGKRRRYSSQEKHANTDDIAYRAGAKHSP